MTAASPVCRTRAPVLREHVAHLRCRRIAVDERHDVRTRDAGALRQHLIRRHRHHDRLGARILDQQAMRDVHRLALAGHHPAPTVVCDGPA